MCNWATMFSNDQHASLIQDSSLISVFYFGQITCRFMSQAGSMELDIFDICLNKSKNNQILLNKISHRF
jgi:hypothetical protein